MINYLIEKYMVMIVSGMVGTLGFCLFFQVKRNKLIYGCIGGLLSLIAYLICVEMGLSMFLQYMIAAMAATIYAEVIARYVKAPSTVFLIPSVVPLTPGSYLYYTMRAIVDADMHMAEEMGKNTLFIALGIALGIVLISLIFYQFGHRNVQMKVKI